MTHIEHAKKAGIKTCTVHHITFGGWCLNCGWKPETEAEKAKRLARNKKARERHWRKTGLGDKTIKWMELHNWL